MVQLQNGNGGNCPVVRPIQFAVLLSVITMMFACGDGPATPTSSTPVVIGGTNPTNPGAAATVGFTEDIKPILDTDCVRCHNTRNANGRVDLSTYAAVMREVRAGNAASPLVRVAQQGGSMYREWSGDRAAKATLLRRWVVDFQAKETR